MATEAEQWKFRATILDAANQGKIGPLVKLLRADHPITAEDKLMLADYLDGKLALKRKRGRPVQKLYSHTWQLGQAVKQVRDYQKRYDLKRSLAIDLVLHGAGLQGKDLYKRRVEIMDALDRGKKTRTK